MGKGMRAGKVKKMQQPSQQQQLQALTRMQSMMEEKQAEIEAKEVTTTSGGGAVSVTVTGKKEVKEIVLSKDVVDPDDIEMLQDLIMVAVNEGLRQIDEISNEEMSKVTGGLNIPGLGF